MLTPMLKGTWAKSTGVHTGKRSIFQSDYRSNFLTQPHPKGTRALLLFHKKRTPGTPGKVITSAFNPFVTTAEMVLCPISCIHNLRRSFWSVYVVKRVCVWLPCAYTDLYNAQVLIKDSRKYLVLIHPSRSFNLKLTLPFGISIYVQSTMKQSFLHHGS